MVGLGTPLRFWPKGTKGPESENGANSSNREAPFIGIAHQIGEMRRMQAIGVVHSVALGTVDI